MTMFFSKKGSNVKNGNSHVDSVIPIQMKPETLTGAAVSIADNDGKFFDTALLFSKKIAKDPNQYDPSEDWKNLEGLNGVQNARTANAKASFEKSKEVSPNNPHTPHSPK